MKVYIAAPYKSVAATRVLAQLLVDTGYGFEISSSWLTESEAGMEPIDVVTRDLSDIDSSDALLLLTCEHPFNGRHVEAGYALAKNIPVVVLGPPTNIFYTPGVVFDVVTTWHQAVNALRDINNAAKAKAIGAAAP